MENKRIKVKVTAHMFDAFMHRTGISDVDDSLNKLGTLSYGNLVENSNGIYLNFPLVGGQIPLAREDDHYVAKTFYKTFGTDKGKEVKVEYIY